MLGENESFKCKHCGGLFPRINYGARCYFESIHEKYCNVGLGTTSLSIQVDGSHYNKLAIQPAEYSYKNNLNWHQGEIIKYITRYQDKNGKVDLQKAKHLIDMLIEFEYGN